MSLYFEIFTVAYYGTSIKIESPKGFNSSSLSLESGSDRVNFDVGGNIGLVTFIIKHDGVETIRDGCSDGIFKWRTITSACSSTEVALSVRA